MAITAQTIINTAAREIGLTESPAGSNRTKFGVWYGMNGQPWCAMFVSWVFAQAGALALIPGGRFAYCPYGVNAFKKVGALAKTPTAGDIAFFDWNGDGVADHVGIVAKVLSKTQIETIEGNTSLTSAGSQSNGGAVARRTRATSSVLGYGRPAYGQDAAPVLPPVEAPAFPLKAAQYFGRGRNGVTKDAGLKVWQQRMQDRGWTIAADGEYGPQTERVVRLFQAEKGLAADGLIGPKTWDAAWKTPVI